MDDQPKEGEGDKKIVHVYPLVKVSIVIDEIDHLQLETSMNSCSILVYRLPSCDKWET